MSFKRLLDGCILDGWVGGWMDGKAGLRIAYSNQKPCWKDGWMDGWMDGWKEGKAGFRIAYSNQKSSFDVLALKYLSVLKRGP